MTENVQLPLRKQAMSFEPDSHVIIIVSQRLFRLIGIRVLFDGLWICGLEGQRPLFPG